MPKGADSFIQQVAKEAGAIVLKRFGKDGLHYLKSAHRSDAVTKADLIADKMITSQIKKQYPTHGIIAEESGSYNTEAEYVWIIDPIDGTLNYSLGVPMFGVMVCLAHKNEVILSAVYLPVFKQLFYAKKGGGAYLNGKRIHTSREIDLNSSVGTSGMSLVPKQVNFLKKILDLASKKNGIIISTLGSMAINACYVASGKRDWMTTFVGQTHDFAPISIILKESGCKVTDAEGRPWRLGQLEMVAANPRLHKQLLKLTKGI